MDNITMEAVTLLREYAENRWFAGERAVAELHAKQKEELEENWSAELKANEQNDPESELHFMMKEQEEERSAVFAKYSKKYHEIHDTIKKLEAAHG